MYLKQFTSFLNNSKIQELDSQGPLTYFITLDLQKKFTVVLFI